MLSIYLSLIDDIKNKDKFTQLYETYKEKMFYVANSILKNAPSAEDAVHEAFIRVIKNIDKISDVFCPQTEHYLVIIVRHVALSMVKSNRNHEIPIPDDEVLESEYSALYLEDECLSKINFEIIVNEIQKLPEIYKDAIYLDCVMSMTTTEIAEMLSITKEAVKKRLQRGKKILIKKLKEESIIYDK